MQSTQSSRFLAAVLLLALVPASALAGAQTVREPAYGLPHIFADTDLELARENGREIARDRLAQIILLSRVGPRHALPGVRSARPLDPRRRHRGAAHGLHLRRARTHVRQACPPPSAPTCSRTATASTTRSTRSTAASGPSRSRSTLLRSGLLDLDDDLFGNATNISDQVDPYYRAPGGADPERTAGGFQFTPEMALSIGVLEVRNFGFNTLRGGPEARGAPGADREARRAGRHRDLARPLLPERPARAGHRARPDDAGLRRPARAAREAARAPRRGAPLSRGATGPARSPRARSAPPRAREYAARLGAWPKIGSYAWAIGASRSATGNPWIGGFPQTGIQTPSIMHFVENRSRESIQAIGMEFAGAPFVLIGQTDTVAYTTTTAQARVVDTFFEDVVLENADALRYVDEGTPAPLAKRARDLRAARGESHTFWRSHERNGNGGSRPVVDFLGDAEGTATAGSSAGALEDVGALFDLGVRRRLRRDRRRDGRGSDPRRSRRRRSTALDVADRLHDAARHHLGLRRRPGRRARSPPSRSTAPSGRRSRPRSSASRGSSRPKDVLDVRKAVRLIPSTHNFPAADNRAWNGIGTNLGRGNIAYCSSGFARHRRRGGEAAADRRHAAEPARDGGGRRRLGDRDDAARRRRLRREEPRAARRELPLPLPGPAGRRVRRARHERQRREADAPDRRERRRRAHSSSAPWGVVPAPGDTYEV